MEIFHQAENIIIESFTYIIMEIYCGPMCEIDDPFQVAEFFKTVIFYVANALSSQPFIERSLVWQIL